MTHRILHVISSPEGMAGAEHVLSDLTRRGELEGWTQCVVQPFARDAPDGALAREIRPVRVIPLPCRSPMRIPELLWSLRREIHRFRPDIVHAHLFHAALLVAAIPRGRGVKVLTHHHGAVLRSEGRVLAHRLDRLAVRRFDCVVAVSEAVRRFVMNELGVPPQRAVVIRNGFAGQPLEPRRLDRSRVVSVARLRPEKAHDILLRAVAVVRQSVPSVELHLLGDGPRRRDLEALAVELGIRERVNFHGAVTDVWHHLAAADVFCLPSRNEPFGISLLEAMAAGLPVVATSSGGVPELVEEGRTGYLVPIDDVHALADRLIAVLSDPPSAHAMGRAGRKVAASMTVEKMCDAYVELYESLIGSRP